MEQQNDLHFLAKFRHYLLEEEKSDATIEKYLRDVGIFVDYLDHRPLCKEETIAYKEQLKKKYAPASVNSMLIALNRFLRFLGCHSCCVKPLQIQRQIYCNEDKELTKTEYQRLVKAANGSRLSYILQTICGTGIRVSELQHITVQAVRDGKAVVNCKNKTRIIFIPIPIQKQLKEYIKKSGVQAGSVFVTKGGRPIDRSNLWREMRALCERAEVSAKKVFPHNLRHLFARTFYTVENDIVRLADLLGHSSINTTRIYTAESGNRHIQLLEKVQKILTT